MLACAFFTHFGTRDRGCSAHPAFPAPSVLREGQTNLKSSGKTCRENARPCLIVIARSEATRHKRWCEPRRRSPPPWSKTALSDDGRYPRPGTAFRCTHRNIFDCQKMLGDPDVLDHGFRNGDRSHFRNRNRRRFVSLFRSKRRRPDIVWKHTELARYLLERLLLVGPVQGGVVEAVHDGGFDDLEVRRDVEIARHVQ